MSSFREVRARLVDARDLLVQAVEGLDATWAGLVEAQPGFPPSHGRASEGGKSSVVWCEDHEREVRECRRADESCDGVPLPERPDPTGDAALAGDRATRDLEQLVAVAKRLHGDAEVLDAVRRRYGHQLTAEVREELRRLACAGDDGCESCRRVGVWSPPRFEHRTDVKGNLSEPMWLCRWCWDWVSATGSVPSRAQLRAHHDGKRVPRPEVKAS